MNELVRYYKSLFQLWDFLDSALYLLDDCPSGLSELECRRLAACRRHIRSASLALFPVGYHGVVKNADSIV